MPSNDQATKKMASLTIHVPLGHEVGLESVEPCPNPGPRVLEGVPRLCPGIASTQGHREREVNVIVWSDPCPLG